MHTLEDTLKAYDKEFPNVERWKYETYAQVAHNLIITSHINFLKGEIERLEDRLKLMEKAELTGLGLPHENSPEIYGNRRIVAYAEGGVQGGVQHGEYAKDIEAISNIVGLIIPLYLAHRYLNRKTDSLVK